MIHLSHTSKFGGYSPIFVVEIPVKSPMWSGTWYNPQRRSTFNCWDSTIGNTVWPYPLVICYIAIENGPFIVDLPIENGDFP